jgi:hypothetical protein
MSDDAYSRRYIEADLWRLALELASFLGVGIGEWDFHVLQELVNRGAQVMQAEGRVGTDDRARAAIGLVQLLPELPSSAGEVSAGSVAANLEVRYAIWPFTT